MFHSLNSGKHTNVFCIGLFELKGGNHRGKSG
jgi:hypothetical protein